MVLKMLCVQSIMYCKKMFFTHIAPNKYKNKLFNIQLKKITKNVSPITLRFNFEITFEYVVQNILFKNKGPSKMYCPKKYGSKDQNYRIQISANKNINKITFWPSKKLSVC